MKLNFDKLETLEESQNVIYFYNYALLLYLNKQYGQCLQIVEKVYNQFMELIDERLCRQITILLIELLIQTHQVNKLCHHS